MMGRILGRILGWESGFKPPHIGGGKMGCEQEVQRATGRVEWS